MKTKLPILIIFIFSSLSGCSNYSELNEIAIVLGVGIDYNPEKDTYEAVYQVVNPKENAAKQTGSGATPVHNLKTSGKTLSEAANNTAHVFSRKNIYSHIQLVIIGEQLAKKESLNFIFDVFERDARVRVNVPVVIARGDQVKTTMDILPTIDQIPVRTMVGKLRNSSRLLGEYGEIKINEVIEDLTSLGAEVAINGISIKGDKKAGSSKENIDKMQKAYVALNGVAIFKKGKLVGWLDGKKTKSIQIINNKVENTNIKIHCNKKRYNSVMVNHLKHHSKVHIKNNQAVITVQANAFGYISELLCNKDITKRKVIKEFEKKAEQELEKEIKEGIIEAQKLKSDVFGFGEILRITHQSQWKKYKHQWGDLFSEAKVNVEVNLEIEGTGMRISPYPY
ncbi:Ger(x)C family spore germination protein [Neobacillus drentensis]|uniref:Ger(x)C family spore germination protein n=1 Tax=Neobacillus drentensis TaxID=220684 RepID=UPI002FFF9690